MDRITVLNSRMCLESANVFEISYAVVENTAARYRILDIFIFIGHLRCIYKLLFVILIFVFEI